MSTNKSRIYEGLTTKGVIDLRHLAEIWSVLGDFERQQLKESARERLTHLNLDPDTVKNLQGLIKLP